MLMIHQSSNKGGMSGMEMVDKVDGAGGRHGRICPRRLSPDVRAPKMKIGAKVPVLLNLSDGTAVAVAFEVRNASGK